MSFLDKLKTGIGIDNTPDETEDGINDILNTEDGGIGLGETGEKATESGAFNAQTSSAMSDEDDGMSGNAITSVVIAPKAFDDCRKIAKYIKNNKMVTINLEDLGNEADDSRKTAQRLMDFLAGAMSIKDAKFLRISNTVYSIVPKGVVVPYEGRKNETEKMILDIDK